MAFPHLLVAAAMTLAIFTLTLRAADGGRWRDLLLISFLTLALGLSHGYDLIPTMLVPAALVALETVRSAPDSGAGPPGGRDLCRRRVAGAVFAVPDASRCDVERSAEAVRQRGRLHAEPTTPSDLAGAAAGVRGLAAAPGGVAKHLHLWALSARLACC